MTGIVRHGVFVLSKGKTNMQRHGRLSGTIYLRNISLLARTNPECPKEIKLIRRQGPGQAGSQTYAMATEGFFKSMVKGSFQCFRITT